MHEVLLVTVTDENEANIIQELLKVNNIISLRKHRGIGGYIQIVTGSSSYGSDIFVLESQFDQANDILASYNGSLIDEEDVFFEEDTLNEEENLKDNKNGEDTIENDEDSNLRLHRMIKLIVVAFFLFLIFVLSRQSNL